MTALYKCKSRGWGLLTWEGAWRSRLMGLETMKDDEREVERHMRWMRIACALVLLKERGR